VEFLREAKHLYPDTIRIVLSGYTELQSVTDAINEGAVYRFLTKPWDDSQLRAFIEEAFRHKELADENRQLNLKIRTANQELATSNRQLQEVLIHKQQQIARGELSLNVVRDALHSLPIPIMGLDEDGLIAFMNRRVQRLFSTTLGLLGAEVAIALPALDALLASVPEGEYGLMPVDNHAYRVEWHRMGDHSTSRGRIVTFCLDEVSAWH
jgi:PAS domain-containing protein